MCDVCKHVEAGLQGMYDVTILRAGRGCLAANLAFSHCVGEDDYEKMMEMLKHLKRYKAPDSQRELPLG